MISWCKRTGNIIWSDFFYTINPLTYETSLSKDMGDFLSCCPTLLRHISIILLTKNHSSSSVSTSFGHAFQQTICYVTRDTRKLLPSSFMSRLTNIFQDRHDQMPKIHIKSTVFTRSYRYQPQMSLCGLHFNFKYN